MNIDYIAMIMGYIFLCISGTGILCVVFAWTLEKVFKALCSAKAFVLFCKWVQERKT